MTIGSGGLGGSGGLVAGAVAFVGVGLGSQQCFEVRLAY